MTPTYPDLMYNFIRKVIIMANSAAIYFKFFVIVTNDHDIYCENEGAM